MHAEHLSPDPSPSCKGNTTLKRPLRWKKNCTYCPGQSELCWGPQLQEKTELVSPFGLWELPRHKAEAVPQIVIDLALIVESPSANWQWRLLLPGLWVLREQTSPLQRENSSLLLFPGLRGEHRALQQRGAGLCSPLQAVHPIKLCCDMQVLTPPSGLAFPREGCYQHLLLPGKYPTWSHAEAQGQQNQYSRKAMTDSTFSMGFLKRGFHLCTRLCLSAIALSKLSSRYLGTRNSDQ